jgi:cytoskeleton protein RodZ
MQSADSDAPIAEIGATLARARQESGLSIDDVSARTRIRGSLIRQIEHDDFSGCGAAVYARGHVRSLAHLLGVDDGPLIDEFDRRHHTGPGPVAPTLRADHDTIAARDMKTRRGARWVPAMAVSLAAVCAFAIVGLVTGGSSASSSGTPTAQAARQPTTAATTPAGVSPSPSAVAFAGVDVRVQVTAGASWLSVRDDSQHVLLQQVLQPGSVRDFKAPKEIQLVLGNAGAVSVTCNGHPFGAAGAPGQVVTVAFNLAASGDCTAG